MKRECGERVADSSLSESSDTEAENERSIYNDVVLLNLIYK